MPVNKQDYGQRWERSAVEAWSVNDQMLFPLFVLNIIAPLRL
jgi:hypothetical protein